MKNGLRTITMVMVLAVTSGVANAGIIITNRNADPTKTGDQGCTEKVDSGIIITNLAGIIITNLTGIIITNATGDGQLDCGIIITN